MQAPRHPYPRIRQASLELLTADHLSERGRVSSLAQAMFLVPSNRPQSCRSSYIAADMGHLCARLNAVGPARRRPQTSPASSSSANIPIGLIADSHPSPTLSLFRYSSTTAEAIANGSLASVASARPRGGDGGCF